MKKRTDHPFEYEGNLEKRYERATRVFSDTELAATSNDRNEAAHIRHCQQLREVADEQEW